MTKFRMVGVLLLTLWVSACVTPLPTPDQVVVPTPILNNSGEFMSPYTQDGVLAPWVDKAVNVKLATSIGSTVGSIAAQQAMGQVPLVGGFLGDWAGRTVARNLALEAIGGEAYIKSTSDISFHTVDDLAVYIYAKNSTHPAYNDALSATMEIYPDLKTKYNEAIANATSIQSAGKK